MTNRSCVASATSDLQQHADGSLDQLLDGLEEGDRLPPIDDPVIVRQRDVHHRADDHLAVDGDGVIWAFVGGRRPVLRIDPDGGRAGIEELNTLLVGDQHDSDSSGFRAAHVAAREADSDGDDHTGGHETDNGFNPFDGTSPSSSGRWPAVIDLVASLGDGGDSVRLEWDTRYPYPEYLVLRNGRRIAGNPFPGGAAADGVEDSSVPGGTHVYRVIGLTGPNPAGGGGAGLDVEEGEIDDPHSLSEEVSVTVGQGEVIVCADLFDSPEAVAFDLKTGTVAVAIVGGILQLFDTQLQLQEEIGLPANPFAFTEIRGMAFEPGQPLALLLLLDTGEVFRKPDGQDPELLYELPEPPVEEGYTGLEVREDLLFITSGPGAECFIGMQIEDGDFVTTGNNLSALLGQDLDHNAGVGVLPGGDLIFGVGAGGSTIDQAVRINVSGKAPQLQFADGGSNVPLDGLGSEDLADLAVAPGQGLLVADRWNSQLCLLAMSDDLPASPTISQVTPGNGPWNAERIIEVSGAAFGDDANDVQVRIDSVEVDIDSFEGPDGPIRVTAPPLGEARAVAVSVHNSQGHGALDPGYVYGFRHGDANSDGSVDVSDAVYLLLWLFNNGDDPLCLDAADPDDSGDINLTDPIFVLDFLFRGGPSPPPPFLEYCLDPSEDVLDCTGS